MISFLGLAVLASCANSKKITKLTDSKDPVMNLNINGMISRPMLVDLTVDNTRKEVTYQAKLNISEMDRKANAKQLFLETHNCDFIVDPIYTSTYTDMNGTVTDTDPAGSSSGMGIGEMNTAFRIGW